MTSPSVPLNQLSASEAADLIAGGAISSESLVGACLERISRREPVVRAWRDVNPERALEHARHCDRTLSTGPLHGVPVAVKDVLDTHDFATRMGSPIYRDYRPFADASCVARIRAAGAIILGKTETAEFAGMSPGPTTNPHNPAHTPGGSSSGSAAAVADFMVPVAFGTQTGGSILRPASFCGIIGFKPTYGSVNRAGLKFAAESLDTIGLMARTIDDIELFFSVLLGRNPSPSGPKKPNRIGVCRTPLWDSALPETRDAISALVKSLAGDVDVVETVWPDSFAVLTEARTTINHFERSRALAWEWQTHRTEISESMQRSVEIGLNTTHAVYTRMRNAVAECRNRLPEFFGDADLLIAPCVPGEAPVGLSHTGDPAFQGPWTALGVPTLSLPTHRGPKGLPVGVQLIGRTDADIELLQMARWIWDTLHI